MQAVIFHRLIYITALQTEFIMFMKKELPVFIVINLIFVSCTKEAIHEPDTIKPEIKVVYPTDHPAIPTGFPLCMQVMITDNVSLSKVWLQVNDGAGLKKEYEIPGRIMSITEKYAAPTGTNGQLTATFFALDEGSNLSSVEIKFTVNN